MALSEEYIPEDAASYSISLPRLAYIVYFRAIAILLIVAGHSYDLASIQFANPLDVATSVLLKGNTAIFVFISGFFFDYVYRKNYTYLSFIKGKAQKTLFPYLVLTFLAELVFWELQGGETPAQKIYKDLLLGDTFQAYWYIPFILIMFALAPGHRLFMLLKTPFQIGLILAMIVLAGCVQRPLYNDNVFQSALFYTPIYLSGLLLSLNREVALPYIKRNVGLLMLATTSLMALQALMGQTDNMHRSFFSPIQGFELMVLQKLALSLALIALFARFRTQPNRLVKLVADTSFAIFFIHPFVLRLISGTGFFELTHMQWFDLTIATTVVVAICILIAVGLKALLKSVSKYVIGY